MVNQYSQTSMDAKTAAVELSQLGKPIGEFSGDGDSVVRGWKLCDLSRNDKTWDDGDWREEWSEAVLDEHGEIWIFHHHESYQETMRGGHVRNSRHGLHQMSALDLSNQPPDDFRRIRSSIKALI